MIAPIGQELLDGLIGYRPLSKGDVVALSARYRETGDIDARNELVERLLPFAIKVARQYVAAGNNGDEAMSAATWGLMRAVETYSPDQGTILRRVEYYVRSYVREERRKSRLCGVKNSPEKAGVYAVRDCDVSADNASFMDSVSDDCGNSAVDEASLGESFAWIRDSIDSIDDESDRDLINRRLAGETLADIARDWGTDPSSVRDRWQRIAKWLIGNRERIQAEACLSQFIERFTDQDDFPAMQDCDEELIAFLQIWRDDTRRQELLSVPDEIRVGNRRLSGETVSDILDRLNAGESQRSIAKRFGVSKTFAGQLRRKSGIAIPKAAPPKAKADRPPRAKAKPRYRGIRARRADANRERELHSLAVAGDKAARLELASLMFEFAAKLTAESRSELVDDESFLADVRAVIDAAIDEVAPEKRLRRGVQRRLASLISRTAGSGQILTARAA